MSADHGPVQAALSARLAAAGLGDVEVGLAERSPLGGPAFRLRLSAHEDLGRDRVAMPPDRAPERVGATQFLAGDVERWAEVERVAVRPPHLYVRLSTDALHRWALGPLPDRVVTGRVVGYRLPVIIAGRSLDAVRLRAVATALVRLGEARGDRAVIVERNDPADADTLVVGPVEVPHGPLRARHGGSVDADDLMADLHARRGDGAAAIVRFALLRTRAARRLRLDDGRLQAAADQWAEVHAAPAGRFDEPAVRRLALELERVPATLAHAARRADPSLLAGLMVSLAGALTPGSDPLLTQGRDRVDRLCHLLDVAAPVPATALL
jgi:hypothetical protein